VCFISSLPNLLGTIMPCSYCRHHSITNLVIFVELFVQVAKAVFDGQLLDVHFTRSFYKHMLGAKVTYHDIEAVDPDYYKNLKWMLEVWFLFLQFMCMNQNGLHSS
jgi:hypothetical protein